MRLNRMESEELKSFLKVRKSRSDREGCATGAGVAAMLSDIAKEGIEAVRRFTETYDGIVIEDFRIPESELMKAWETADGDWRSAMETAAAEIASYHKKQLESGFEDRSLAGVVRGMRILPMERVGLYVPGGRAAYPSTLLMNAIPAQLAGVKELVVFSPPDGNGLLHPAVMATAYMLGIKECYAIGGVQAVGVAAYGVEGIRGVDKLVGPGNAYVAEAKRQVFGKIGIDMVAGPSEVLVIATDQSIPEYVAMDLMAQAEHDPDACSILLTPSENFADAVERALEVLLPQMERCGIIKDSLAQNGICVVTKDLDEAFDLSNAYAPEHLELCYPGAEDDLERVRAAGSVFLGPWTPEATGDYVTGTNHTLPTMGSAKFQSPLGVYDFVKRMAYASYTKEALRSCAGTIRTIASSEGLEAHWRSVGIRLEGSGILNSMEGCRLNANENPKSIRLKDIFGEAGLDGVDLNRYPDPSYKQLRTGLAEWISERIMTVASENIVCGNGSDECIRMVYDALLEPGDRILAIGRTFGEYGIIARAKGVSFQETECLEDKSPDIDVILSKLEAYRPNLLIICNPNNPTGFEWPRAWLEKVLDGFSGYVLMDEAYGEFISGTMVDRALEDRRTVVIRTLSKFAGLAGIRFGYTISDRTLAERINAVRMPYNINVLTQAVVEQYLNNNFKSDKSQAEDDDGSLKELKRRIRNLYDLVNESPLVKACDIIPYEPSANFLFLKVKKGIDKRLMESLEKRSVKVRVFAGNQENPYTAIRISAGLAEEMEAVTKAFQEVMAC